MSWKFDISRNQEYAKVVVMANIEVKIDAINTTCDFLLENRKHLTLLVTRGFVFF